MPSHDSTRGWWIPLPILVAVIVVGVHGSAERIEESAHPEKVWESVEVARGDGFALFLRHRRCASPDMDLWIEFECVNRTGAPLLVKDLDFSFNYDLQGLSSGGCSRGAEREFWLPEGAKRLRLDGTSLSRRIAANVPVARPDTGRLELTCMARMDTARGSSSYGDMPPSIEVTWRRPGAEGLARLKRELEAALDSPGSERERDVGAWLQKPTVAGHLGPGRLLKALEQRGRGARSGILRSLVGRFGDHPTVRGHYIDRLQAGDLTALSELSQATRYGPGLWAWRTRPVGARMPTPEAFARRPLWSPAFVEPVVRLIETTPRSWWTGFWLLEHYGAPQARDPELAAQLGTALRRANALVPVDHRRRQELGMPPFLATFRLMAQTRDPAMLPVLVAQLRNHTVLDKLTGFPEEYGNFGPFQSPPPRRARDAALDAILALRGVNLAKAYKESGWSLKAHAAIGLPIVDGKPKPAPRGDWKRLEKIGAERGRWLDALRDRMIAKLKEELAKER